MHNDLVPRPFRRYTIYIPIGFCYTLSGLVSREGELYLIHTQDMALGAVDDYFH